MDFLKQRFPLTPIFCAEHLPEKVIFPHEKAVYDPGFLNGKRVLAFAGIAQPEGFKSTLLELGADVIHFRGFRDHHPFRRKEMETLTHLKEETGAHFLITIPKPMVKPEPRISLDSLSREETPDTDGLPLLDAAEE